MNLRYNQSEFLIFLLEEIVMTDIEIELIQRILKKGWYSIGQRNKLIYFTNEFGLQYPLEVPKF